MPSASGTLPPELRESLSPKAVEALEGLWAEIEKTLAPLFFDSADEIARRFQRVYPTFAALYLSTTLMLVAALEQERFAALAGHGFDALRDLLRKRGPERLGPDATIAAMMGLHTMTRVFRAAAKPLEDTARAKLDEVAGEWTAMTTAYMLAAFAVAFALANAERFLGHWENVAQLAFWSRSYAVEVYDLSRRCGLLKPAPAPPGPLPESSTEEELLLAEASAERLKEILAEDEAEDG